VTDVLEVEQLVRLATGVELEGIEVRQVVADLAIGVDQARHRGLRPRGVLIDVVPGHAVVAMT